MNELKDISVLLFTGGHGSPDAFRPASAVIAACPLRDTTVNDGMSNLSFGSVVGGFHQRIGQELEVAFGGLAFKPTRQRLGQSVIRRFSYPVQKPLLNGFHPSCKTGRRQRFISMQGLEQLFDPVQQQVPPACQRLPGVFGQEANFPDQMGHAVLNRGIGQPGELAVASIVVTIQNALEVFAKQLEKHLAAPRWVDVKQAIAGRLKTPGPVLVSLVFMTGFVHPQVRLMRQTLHQRVIHGFQCLRDLLRGFAQQAPRKRQFHRLATELLDGREGHMATAFHKGDPSGHIRSQQVSLNHFGRQGGDVNRSGSVIPVFSGPMFRYMIQLLGKRDLLDHVPLIQRLQIDRIACAKFVLDNLIDLFRWKRRSAEFAMARLTSPFTFLTRMRDGLAHGFYNVTRRGLGRIIRVLLQTRDAFSEFLIFLFEPSYLGKQLFDNLIGIHALGLSYRPQKRNYLSYQSGNALKKSSWTVNGYLKCIVCFLAFV